MATWGEKLVPLERFRQAAAKAGRTLAEQEREEVRQSCRATAPDPTPVEGPYSRIAVFGGVYSNHQALAALLEDATRRGAEAIYCLGDLGGFGPNPEKVRPLLEQGGVLSIQGNYEESLASGREDCNCGYTDPRDNHFAEISYRYTERSCSPGFKAWMGTLPRRRRVRLGDRELLLIHGSPRRINEFLFQQHLSGALPGGAAGSERLRRPPLHPYRPALAPAPPLRAGRGQRRGHRPAGQRRQHPRLVRLGCSEEHGVELAACLRSPVPGRGDAPRRAAGGVRGDDPDRLVDHLPGDPARPREGGFRFRF